MKNSKSKLFVEVMFFKIGQKLKIGHIGEQVINILPLCPYSRVLNKDSYFCKLHKREIRSDECAEIQDILRKPEEIEVLQFSLNNSISCCPNCFQNALIRATTVPFRGSADNQLSLA